ncbi:hypothetical protein EYF80_066629 [Liparis tanakae]|uniref:Uncharacterized protein n=1 Tax=Liparis tanakae TaxID=230148 RepID=A0A4Z2E4I6_9TELE|nr:hypothetical protein EYF80_066629 [Liparis tanakae]
MAAGREKKSNTSERVSGIVQGAGPKVEAGRSLGTSVKQKCAGRPPPAAAVLVLWSDRIQREAGLRVGVSTSVSLLFGDDVVIPDPGGLTPVTPVA